MRCSFDTRGARVPTDRSELQSAMLERVRGLPPETLRQIAAMETDSVSRDGGRHKLE